MSETNLLGNTTFTNYICLHIKINLKRITKMCSNNYKKLCLYLGSNSNMVIEALPNIFWAILHLWIMNVDEG